MLIATYAYIITPHLGTLANAGSLLLGTQSLGTALQSLTSL